MRRLILALSAAALLAGPALAQPGGYGRPGGDPGGDYRAQQGPGRGDDRRNDRGGYRNDDRPGWQGGRRMAQRSWMRHVRVCTARYRSYNPRTDRYVVRRGVTARCTL